MRGAGGELVRSGALPLEWGEALETRLFPECYVRLARVEDVPGLPGWGGCAVGRVEALPDIFWRSFLKIASRQ